MTVVAGRTRAQVEAIRQETLKAEIRRIRDEKIREVTWRVERNARETALGIPVTEDIQSVFAYIQSLCEIPEQTGFPAAVVWPREP